MSKPFSFHITGDGRALVHDADGAALGRTVRVRDGAGRKVRLVNVFDLYDQFVTQVATLDEAGHALLAGRPTIRWAPEQDDPDLFTALDDHGAVLAHVRRIRSNLFLAFDGNRMTEHPSLTAAQDALATRHHVQTGEPK